MSENNFVKQQFLPDQLNGKSIWHAQSNPAESKLKEHLKHLWGDRYNK